MKKIIGVIASDDTLKQRIEELYSNDVENGNIIIDIINVELLENQGRILVEKGAQAIIGRGGGYKLILETVNVPIIPLNMKVIDLLKAIKIASSKNKEIILIVGYDEIFFNYDEWRNLLNLDITEEWFKSKLEIRNKVLKYIDRKDDIVIVGSGIACSFATQYGIENVFINASDESIRESIDHAKRLLETIEEEKFNNEVLTNVLDGVKDGVIAIDDKGRIVLYNESACKIFKTNKKDVFNKYILDVFPHMNWLVEALEKKENSQRKIRHIDNLIVNTRANIIKVDNNIYGILGIIQDITKLQSLERKIRFDLNKKGLYAKYTFSNFIHKDKITSEFISEAKNIGRSEYTILLYGESGVGKEILAQSIHNISKRKEKPFVAINCATISESLLESELFGYEDGAFTGARKGGKPGLFELAHEGTVFLDEVNSLPLNIQTKLLRVIEEREIMRIGSDKIIPLDIRIIVATNESLVDKINNGSFRADLFYRLSSLEINIPPLRERKEDIILLFEYFINETLHDESLNNTSIIGNKFELTDNEIKKLMNYNWPGNVRELKNVAKKYVITGKIKLNDIKIVEKDMSLLDIEIKDSPIDSSKLKINIKDVNKYVEEKIISMLLEQGISKNEVAQILGISRTALWKKSNKNN